MAQFGTFASNLEIGTAPFATAGSGVLSFIGRTGAVVALQADYDAFFLTPAEGNAAYGTLAATNLNTAKVTNATHTGQVTGSGALALTVNAITDQAASGALIGADTMIVNDGGLLREATMDQVATFVGGTIVAGVSSFNTRTGAVVPIQADYDSFFLTPAEGNAAYGTLAATNLNTAKVTNATHTGQITGSGALVANVTLITAQTGIGGVLAGADTFLVNDGGLLREITATQMDAFFATTSLAASAITAGNLISTVLPFSTAVNTNSSFQVPFLNTTGVASGNFGLQHETGAGSFTYNPSTATLTATLMAATTMTATLVNGIALTTGGVATNYLDQTGAYSVPAGGAAGLPSETKVKTTTQTVNNSTTMVDDNALVGFTVVTGKWYRFHFEGEFVTTTNADLDFDFVFSATPTAGGRKITATINQTALGDYENTPLESEERLQGAAGTQCFRISGWFRANQFTGSTFKLQWAQGIAEASNTQILAGAWLTLEQTAL